MLELEAVNPRGWTSDGLMPCLCIHNSAFCAGPHVSHRQCCDRMIRNRDPYIYEYSLRFDYVDLFKRAYALKIPKHYPREYDSVIRDLVRGDRLYAVRLLVDYRIVETQRVLEAALPVFSPRTLRKMSARDERDPANHAPPGDVRDAFDAFAFEFDSELRAVSDGRDREQIARAVASTGDIRSIAYFEDLGYPMISASTLLEAAKYPTIGNYGAFMYIWRLGDPERRIVPHSLLQKLDVRERALILQRIANADDAETFEDVAPMLLRVYFERVIRLTLDVVSDRFLDSLLEYPRKYPDRYHNGYFAELFVMYASEVLNPERFAGYVEYLASRRLMEDNTFLLELLFSRFFVEAMDALFADRAAGEARALHVRGLVESADWLPDDDGEFSFASCVLRNRRLSGRFDRAFFAKYFPAALDRPWIGNFLVFEGPAPLTPALREYLLSRPDGSPASPP